MLEGRDSKEFGSKETGSGGGGPQGLDEAGLDGEAQLAILENGQVTLSSFQPEDIGMERIEIDPSTWWRRQTMRKLLSVLEEANDP